MDDSDAQFALTRYSQTLWQELRPELPEDVEYEQCGTIWVATDEEEMTEVLRKHAYYSRQGVSVEVLNPGDIERLEPNLRKGMVGGLLVPDDGVLYPPCAARFLMDQAQGRGVTLHLQQTVAQIGKGQLHLADGTRFSSATIVNAAGTWASALTPGIAAPPRA